MFPYNPEEDVMLTNQAKPKYMIKNEKWWVLL